MAITLINSAIGLKSDMQIGMVEEFARSNVVTEFVPVVPVMDTFMHNYMREKSTGTTAVRDINDTYTASNSEYEKKQTQLKIIGGKYTIDRQLDTQEERARQAIGKAKNAAGTVQKLFFDGDASANEFDGLNVFCSDMSNTTNCGAVTTGYATLASAANARTFLADIKGLLEEVRGDRLVYFMSLRMRNLIEQAIVLAGASQLIGRKDEYFGTIQTFDEVPILITSKDGSNNEILAFDETSPDGATATDCGSIYLANLDELSGVTFISKGSNNAADISAGPVDVQNSGENRTYIFEFVLGLAAKATDCVWRLQGIRYATS
jgi:hypothetical protein